MAVIGYTLHAVGATASDKYYSPWFQRQGDAATFSAEVIFNNGATLKVYIETKNTEQPDSAGYITSELRADACHARFK